MYTTHGYMTPADYADYADLYDINAGRDGIHPDCPGHETTSGITTIVDWCGEDDDCPEE